MRGYLALLISPLVEKSLSKWPDEVRCEGPEYCA
jgi:hypothetical protein